MLGAIGLRLFMAFGGDAEFDRAVSKDEDLRMGGLPTAKYCLAVNAVAKILRDVELNEDQAPDFKAIKAVSAVMAEIMDAYVIVNRTKSMPSLSSLGVAVAYYVAFGNRLNSEATVRILRIGCCAERLRALGQVQQRGMKLTDELRKLYSNCPNSGVEYVFDKGYYVCPSCHSQPVTEKDASIISSANFAMTGLDAICGNLPKAYDNVVHGANLDIGDECGVAMGDCVIDYGAAYPLGAIRLAELTGEEGAVVMATHNSYIYSYVEYLALKAGFDNIRTVGVECDEEINRFIDRGDIVYCLDSHKLVSPKELQKAISLVKPGGIIVVAEQIAEDPDTVRDGMGYEYVDNYCTDAGLIQLKAESNIDSNPERFCLVYRKPIK